MTVILGVKMKIGRLTVAGIHRADDHRIGQRLDDTDRSQDEVNARISNFST
jgi:hypothetical protein